MCYTCLRKGYAVDEENGLVLCAIIDDDEKHAQKIKAESFTDDVKLNALNADLFPSVQDYVVYFNKQFFTHSQEILGLVIWAHHVT